MHVVNSMQTSTHGTVQILYVQMHACIYVLEFTVPQGVVLTYNSSSGADGSHIIEHEILQNSEIH